MQPASEKCSYLEELSCKEDSLKDNRFCFNQNQDNTLKFHFSSCKRIHKFVLISCNFLFQNNCAAHQLFAEYSGTLPVVLV